MRFWAEEAVLCGTKQSALSSNPIAKQMTSKEMLGSPVNYASGKKILTCKSLLRFNRSPHYPIMLQKHCNSFR